MDLIDEGRPEVVREAVWSCYQEQPTPFRDYGLFDPGAFGEDPICSTITWRVRTPWYAPPPPEQQAAVDHMHGLMEQIRRKQEEKHRQQ